MDGDKMKESAPDCASGAAEPTKKQEKRKRASAELGVVDKESASAEWQREIDALYEYYKEVSGRQLNPEELSCTTSDSIIACLLEESSLSCAKLTGEIYKRMKLQDGVTESSVRTSVLNIGRRSSYGISAMDVDGLEDESDSSLWCWEGMQCEPVCVKFDEIGTLLSIPGVTVQELNALLQRQKALHIITEHALKIDRPLVISNLDHRKLDLLNAEDITGMLKIEKICLQALCMKKYPGSPIIDVPVVNMTIEDGFCRSNKKSPRTPVSSKAISESDMPEFAKLVASCPQGIVKLVELLHETFPYVSKSQLKNKVREIAEFTNNRWQVKQDILDRYGLSLSPVIQVWLEN